MVSPIPWQPCPSDQVNLFLQQTQAWHIVDPLVNSSLQQTQAWSLPLSSLQQTQAWSDTASHPILLSPQQTQAQLSITSPNTLSLWQTQAQPSITPLSTSSPQQTQAWLLASVLAALDIPSADWCLSFLLALHQHTPPAQPNTHLATDVYDTSSTPAQFGSMQAQLHAWLCLLQDYPDVCYCDQMAGMIHHGCLLGYKGPLHNTNCLVTNLPISKDSHEHLCHKITAHLAEGHLMFVGPADVLVESPIGVVPKLCSTKLCTIHHLSYPRCPTTSTPPSVNSGINLSFVHIQYELIGQLVEFVRANPNCHLWKGNLEDAFCHVVTAVSDATLLGFQYEGICYCENALTFGGRSSPFLFNLVAEFLHWVVAACLPPSWPVNHYLDDTFGTVPAEKASTLVFFPIWVLTLASAALGLHLSAKKTFTNLTHLEVLGININSMAQTISITPEHHAHILAQCRTLLLRGTTDLLDMQHIAGLLQFILQVFPCGKAFLCHLYDCTWWSKHVGHCHIPHPALAKLGWWVAMLESWSGTSILAPLPLIVAHVWTNACP